MQTFDPKKRITVEDALAHPYLEAYVSNIVFIRDRYILLLILGMFLSTARSRR